MKKKKVGKKFWDRPADDIIADVFHPEVAKHLRKHVEEHARRIEEKEKRGKK